MVDSNSSGFDAAGSSQTSTPGVAIGATAAGVAFAAVLIFLICRHNKKQKKLDNERHPDFSVVMPSYYSQSFGSIAANQNRELNATAAGHWTARAQPTVPANAYSVTAQNGSIGLNGISNDRIEPSERTSDETIAGGGEIYLQSRSNINTYLGVKEAEKRPAATICPGFQGQHETQKVHGVTDHDLRDLILDDDAETSHNPEADTSYHLEAGQAAQFSQASMGHGITFKEKRREESSASGYDTCTTMSAYSPPASPKHQKA
ncbi:hypothetical protein PG996_008402 [Apiospora saccharicola]|uniref:Uncharacterized protein n=1 Tax=Apiospora saccharicola TaxID=335842 RepID=A0ABR1UXU9_9PEZI